MKRAISFGHPVQSALFGVGEPHAFPWQLCQLNRPMNSTPSFWMSIKIRIRGKIARLLLSAPVTRNDRHLAGRARHDTFRRCTPQ